MSAVRRREGVSAVRRREGRYLLRTNLRESDPAKLWEFYHLVTESMNRIAV